MEDPREAVVREQQLVARVARDLRRRFPPRRLSVRATLLAGVAR